MANKWDHNRRRKLLVRGTGWCLCVGLWTVALLTTRSMEIGRSVTPTPMHYPASKCLHIFVYGFLTVFVAWLPLRRWRWLLFAFLSLHTAATEYCQQFIPGRTGMMSDVVLDHVGLLFGLALTWKRWVPHSARRVLLGIRSQQF
jgi:VanZ family protein